MKQLVVISGKGGTGKTSIVAAFAALAENSVLADCDVDAADLHLVLEPTIITREDFSGGARARVVTDRCTACGKCEEVCRYDAVLHDGPANELVESTFRVDPIACEGCGVCAWFCEDRAIEFAPAVNGEWYNSETRYGPMVYARLGVAEENSGKLVSLVRTRATTIAEERDLDLIIIDGSPGIGCPVIASITGADLVMVVTEPTLSGMHDLERVMKLTKHFGVDTVVCINKRDLNEKIAREIERLSSEHGLAVVGSVRYDRAFTEAQIHRQSIVEFSKEGAAADIEKTWKTVRHLLKPSPELFPIT